MLKITLPPPHTHYYALHVVKNLLKAYTKPEIYKSNLTTHAIKIGHEFPNINNMTLIKRIPYKGNIMNIRENLHVQTQTNNKLIEEQIQVNTKHDTLFKTLIIENS